MKLRVLQVLTLAGLGPAASHDVLSGALSMAAVSSEKAGLRHLRGDLAQADFNGEKSLTPEDMKVVQAVAGKVAQQEESRVEDAAAKARETEEAKQFLAKAALEAQSESAKDDESFADHLAHIKEVATAKKIMAESADKTSNLPKSGPQLKQSSSSSGPQELAGVDKVQSTIKNSEAQEVVNDPRLLAPKKVPVSTMTAADAAEAHGPHKEIHKQQKTQELKLAVGKDHEEVHTSMRLQKLRLEKNQVRAKLAILKDNLVEAKRAIRKVKQATSRVTKASEKFPGGPLSPQAVSINLARMRNAGQIAVMQRSEVRELSSVVQKLEADKDAEMRAREEERQMHKAVMKDMVELSTVGDEMLQDDHH